MRHTAIIGICQYDEVSMHEIMIEATSNHELRKAEAVALAIKLQIEYDHLDDDAQKEFDDTYDEAIKDYKGDGDAGYNKLGFERYNLYNFKLVFERYYDISISDPVFFKGHTY